MKKSDAEATRQLESLFILNNKDFVRKGNQDDMRAYYDILDYESQSHTNCVSGFLCDKATSESRFCKSISKQEDMELRLIQAAVEFMGVVSHPCIVKVQEVYSSNDKVHLVSASLKGSHKPLSELSGALEESQVTGILAKLLQVCVKLHREGVTIANIHPNNVFVDEDFPEDVLLTDVGFSYMPGMLPELQLQTLF